MIRSAIAAILMLASAAAALAQPGPGPGPPPDPWTVNGNEITYDGCVVVPAAATAGCVRSGTISSNGVFLSPSTVAGATFRIMPGVAPPSPANGEMWTTSLGLYVRINGATVGPLASFDSSNLAGTSPISVTFMGSAATIALGVAPVANGGTGSGTAAGARTNLGLGTISTQDAGSIAITGGTITGMPNPTNPLDVANKQYTDAAAGGTRPLAASQLATAAALPANTYNNGTAGVGATITCNANGALTVDGVLTVVGYRILVDMESSAAHNGIYTVTIVGNGGAACVLTRATDLDQAAEMVQYALTSIQLGDTNISRQYTLNAAVTTVGTDPLNWSVYAFPNGVNSVLGLTGAPGGGTGLFACSPNICTSAFGNERAAYTAAHSLATTECFKGLYLGGNAYYALTLNAASGYNAKCQITVVNEDIYASGGRVKVVHSSAGNFQDCKLYPGTSATVWASNNVWHIACSPRWRPPNGTVVNYYTNYVSGSDSTTDGLTPSAPFKTGQNASNVALTDLDCDGSSSGQTSTVINFAAGITDTEGVHFSPHDYVGCQGGRFFTFRGHLDGSGHPDAFIYPQGSFSGSGAIACYFGIVAIENLGLQSDGHAIDANYNCQAYISGDEFYATLGCHMSAKTGAHIEAYGNWGIQSGAAAHTCTQTGGRFDSVIYGPSFFVDTNFATAFAYTSTLGYTNYGGSIVLNGHTIFGTKYVTQFNGVTFTSTGNCNGFFPGNVNGTPSNGGICQ